jgi:translation initiation factor 5B
MLSPFFFPVSAETFNFVSCSFFSALLLNIHCDFQACVIFGTITIFGVLTWYFTPADKWLRRDQILQALQAADEPQEDHID